MTVWFKVPQCHGILYHSSEVRCLSPIWVENLGVYSPSVYVKHKKKRKMGEKSVNK